MNPYDVVRGDRVVLIATTDPYTWLKPGALGTVTRTWDDGIVDVRWDTGSGLTMIPNAGDMIERVEA